MLDGGRMHFGTGGTAIYILDSQTDRHRPSTTEDIILSARLVDVLDNLHVFTINVIPNEVKDPDRIDVVRFFHSLDNTTKHVMGGLYSLAGCQRVVDMARLMAGGAEELRQRPFVSFITRGISPLNTDRYYGEMTCYLADQGLPIVVPTGPICGMTSPVTQAGNVLTRVVEVLAGIALVQTVRKGAPESAEAWAQ